MRRGVGQEARIILTVLLMVLLGGSANANTWQSLGPWGGEVRSVAADGASWYEYAATWGAGVFRRVPG
ncbi:MAG: hypothetical protein HRF46_16450, partial [Acidobacteriota bacterium]